MDFWAESINLIGISIILAMSLNVICGLTGQLQLGHAGFFAIGAYSAGLTSIYFFHPNWGFLNFIIGCTAAVIATSIFAIAIGVPCLRLRGDYLAIATLGFGEIVRICLQNITFTGTKSCIGYEDGESFGGATGIEMPIQADYIHTTRINPMAEGPFSGFFEKLQTNPFSNSFMASSYDLFMNCWFIWLFVIITTILLLNLKRSAIGRAFLAIRENEIAAQAMGVNVARYKLLSFIICAAFAGVAGALFAHMQTVLNPTQFTLLHTITILLIVVLGGLGSFTGSIIASFLIVGIPVVLTLIPNILEKMNIESTIDFAKYQQILFAFLLIMLIRLVPNGILGLKELRDILPKRRKQEVDNV
jgi:branched-chain amino acid transport system permease protein